MYNAQWYERFNTKVDVSTTIGVTHQHRVLLEYVAQELHAYPFTTITPLEQEAVRIDVEECYLSYAFLFQSSAQHNELKLIYRMISQQTTIITLRSANKIFIS